MPEGHRDENLLRIVGGLVLTPTGWSETDLLVEQGAVVSPRVAGVAGSILDASGCRVVPGFIDLQINGAFGHDFTAGPESIWEVAAELPRFGVTAFLPTIVSSPAEVARRALSVLAGPRPTAGAVPLGLHCEGPMLAPGRRGAHESNHLRPAEHAHIEGWSASAGVRLVTLAPELPGASEIVETLTERGVVVSAGHSDATFDEAERGFAAGISFGTHLFNAMRGLNHREPGLAGALLSAQWVTAGLIADGVHVHPAAVAIAWRAKGPSGIALVTDAVAPLGKGEGTFRLGDAEVRAAHGEVRNASGDLAGSVLSMDRAVRNLVEFTGCSPAEAVAAASSTPARVLGETTKGSIAPGADADLALLDADLGVAATLVGGRVAFDPSGRSVSKSVR